MVGHPVFERRDIYGTFVTLGGAAQPINGFSVRSAAYRQVSPAVAWNGVDFVVAWQESRNTANTQWDTFAAGIRPDGRSFYPQPFQINTNASNQTCPAIAATGLGGKFLVLQQAPYLYMQRIRANVFNLEAIPRLQMFPFTVGTSRCGAPRTSDMPLNTPTTWLLGRDTWSLPARPI